MKKNYIIISAIALILFSACEKLVQIDLPEGVQNIVVDSEISTLSKPWSVRITDSQAFNDQDSAAGVTDAIVVISDDAGNKDTIPHLSNGHYRTTDSKQCVAGRTYTLEIFVDGEYYAASELCRFQYEIDTFLSYYIPENNGFIVKGWYVFEVADEWEEDGDFYLWKVYRNDTLLDGFGYILDEDKFREQSFFNIGFDPNDPLGNIINGRLPRPFPFDFNPPDKVFLEQYCINEGYFNYLIELQNQQNRSGGPFDPPPANPKTNISNGAFGYFSVVNIVTAETVIVE